MANPQKENGHIEIANDLFEAIYMRYSFTARQLAVISTVLRHTYGWQRKECSLSGGVIAAETGIAQKHIHSVINELVESHVLIVQGDKHSRSRKFKINKNYDEWTTTKRVVELPPKEGYIYHQNGGSTTTKVVVDTIQRQLKTGERKRSPVFLGLWEMYPEDKRYGLQYISAEVEEEVVMHADAVKTALEIYVAQTDHKYLCKASKFFEERWKLVHPPAAAKDEEDYWQ